MAYQGHIIVPTTEDQADAVVGELEAKMASTFGGFSTYDGEGGFEMDERIVREKHKRLVFNVPDDHRFDRSQIKNYLKIEASYVKDVLDEECVLIELREIDMELV
jgi:hypothetical protein